MEGVHATLLYACEKWGISKMEHVSNAQILARAKLKQGMT